MKNQIKSYLLLYLIFSSIISILQSCSNSPGNNAGSSSSSGSQGIYSEVIYYGNGNTSGNSPVIISYTNGQTVMIYDDIGFTKTGYRFDDWNTKGDGSGSVYIPGQVIVMGTNNLSLYAQWSVMTQYNIVYFAGNGTNGYSGDGGPALNAEIYGPSQICSDPSNNIFIADRMNCVVRKVDHSSGIITTFAGGGSSGDGPATNASLDYPGAVCSDRYGNIIIADSGNNRIRIVSNSNRYIYTISGNGTAGYSGDVGPASGAVMNYPYGVYADASGNIYISDYNNNRIRIISNLNGMIYTFAGTGQAGYAGDGDLALNAMLNYPAGIASDQSGNIYFADSSNNCIREIDIQSGIIKTVAGDGMQGYTGEGIATIVALNNPYSLYIDQSGNLYIADTFNQRVRFVSKSTGYMSTFAGNGTAGCSGNGGPALSAEFDMPAGVCGDSQGNIYISDCYNSIIWKAYGQ